MRKLVGIVVGAVLCGACAGPGATGIPAGHQSALGETKAAGEHERVAGVLERQAMNEPPATKCGPGLDSGAQICWSDYRISGATTRGLAQAADQRKAAAEHRRVSQALRQAESTACAGISEEDMAASPFAHTEDIVDVQVLRGAAPPGMETPVLGARIHFHELEHLTADWLKRVIDCHLSRDNALGHDVPEMAYCPLVPRGASATVATVPHGFLVDVQSDDPDAGREIARRALALRP